MRKPIEEYTDPNALQRIMENAARASDEDLRRRTFRRLCALKGMEQTDPLHRDFYETLAAYELLLTQKNGRATNASYTRRKLKNKGVVQCLEDWAISKAPTDGFELLIKQGFFELTGEFLVLKYPARFSETAVKNARTRLTDLGVTTLPN
jgi:hypothetical protein